jgi:trimethylamine--corrinoid protein Co-methyltransferase
MQFEQLDNSFFVSTRPHLRLLSSRQIRALHDASLEVLERTGVRVCLPEAVDLLTSAGARVADKDRVRIPAYMMEEALCSVPGQITLGDRNGKPAILEPYFERKPYFLKKGASHG